MSEEIASTDHKQKQNLMEKALDDIIKNGPKLRLGHLPTPGPCSSTLFEVLSSVTLPTRLKSIEELDKKTFKEPKISPENTKNDRRKHRHGRKREYKVPEHVKNPSKFTKYDLSDTQLTNRIVITYTDRVTSVTNLYM